MKQLILDFFQSKSSMMRLCLLIATLCVWGPFAYTFIVTKQPPKLDREVVVAYGFAVGGKAVQAYVEKKFAVDLTTTPKT